mmetsp:Transcript_11690/g.31456  ORF Transcript_11690/g.31456 Transcript_11690/m.31456 type:complete len:231 (-) Transcript_11690:360-1052(-)
MRRYKWEVQWGSRTKHIEELRDLSTEYIKALEDNTFTCIVMKYLDGYQTLSACVTGPATALSQDACAQLLRDLVTKMMKGMVSLGSYFVHRDIKPDNVMVLWGEDEDTKTIGDVKLIDWGLSFHPPLGRGKEEGEEAEAEAETETVVEGDPSVNVDAEVEEGLRASLSGVALSSKPGKEGTQPDEILQNKFLSVSEAGHNTRTQEKRSSVIDVKLLGALYFFLENRETPL